MGRDPKTKLRKFHQARWDEPIIYELSSADERGILVPPVEEELILEVGDIRTQIPASLLRKQPPHLPELSQPQVLRHFLHLSQETLGADLNIDISEATCTLKYNPKINERFVKLPQVSELHPLQDEDTIQGMLQIYYEFEQFLKEISGMSKFSFQAGGGAQAVFTNASIIRAYFESKGELQQRNEVITTMFSHPCDAATPATAGFKVITLMPDENGYPSLEAFKSALSDRTAAVMITNPEDTGIYNPRIREYVQAAHEVGALCSYDQANANGILGITRARDAGFDLCHFNLHKTFSTPHSSMGPGSGAVGVTMELARFLPVPTVEFTGESYFLNYENPESIGKIRAFHGVATNIVRAYAWVLSLGADGLREVSNTAVLNNNYLLKKISEIPGVTVPYAEGKRRLDQVRYSWAKLKEDTGVGTEDVARRIADYGVEHYMTSHHPWIVPEPFTLEPAESYSKEDIDEYVAIIRQVSKEAYENPEFVKNAPYRTPIHKIETSMLSDSKRWATTWRAYQRKNVEESRP